MDNLANSFKDFRLVDNQEKQKLYLIAVIVKHLTTKTLINTFCPLGLQLIIHVITKLCNFSTD